MLFVASNDNGPSFAKKSNLARLQIMAFQINRLALRIIERDLIVRKGCGQQIFFGEIRRPLATCRVTPFDGNCQVRIFTTQAKNSPLLDEKTCVHEKHI